jgi:putative endonuclease
MVTSLMIAPSDVVARDYKQGQFLAMEEYWPDRGKLCHGVYGVDIIVGVVRHDWNHEADETDGAWLEMSPCYLPSFTIKPWYLYVVRCKDGTLYTGVSTDILKRIAKHNAGKGAKYLRSKKRRPVTPVYSERCRGKGLALARERWFKSLSRTKKLEIIRAEKKREQ